MRRDGNVVMKTSVDVLAGLMSGRAKYPFPIKSLNKLFIFIIYTHLSKPLKRSTEAFFIKYKMYVFIFNVLNI